MASSVRVRVKVCGITCREDAEEAIASGADALGFNLWPGSKRFFRIEEHEEWLLQLAPFVSRVALLVNAPLDQAERVARHPAFDAVQLHGDEDAEYCAALARTGRPLIKALRLRDEKALVGIDAFGTRHVLLDAYVEDRFGGTGSLINLDLAADFVRTRPDLRVILAGGLTAENVGDAIRRVRPYAVDVASGIESSIGRKDARKMREFVASARAF